MSKFSRNKGKRFEREVVHLFRAHGFDAHRSAQYKGNTGQAADIEGVPFIHIEAKHQERMRLYEWVQQNVTDAEAEGEDKLPTVIHKENNNSDMTYTYGTATHTCKSLICTKEEHSHTVVETTAAELIIPTARCIPNCVEPNTDHMTRPVFTLITLPELHIIVIKTVFTAMMY